MGKPPAFFGAAAALFLTFLTGLSAFFLIQIHGHFSVEGRAFSEQSKFLLFLSSSVYVVSPFLKNFTISAHRGLA